MLETIIRPCLRVDCGTVCFEAEQHVIALQRGSLEQLSLPRSKLVMCADPHMLLDMLLRDYAITKWTSIYAYNSDCNGYVLGLVESNSPTLCFVDIGYD